MHSESTVRKGSKPHQPDGKKDAEEIEMPFGRWLGAFPRTWQLRQQNRGLRDLVSSYTMHLHTTSSHFIFVGRSMLGTITVAVQPRCYLLPMV
jgi:hypothetical protein